MKYYIGFPDVVQLIDNSILLTPIAVKKDGEWKITAEILPAWFSNYLAPHIKAEEKEIPARDLSNIEEVKQQYKYKKR